MIQSFEITTADLTYIVSDKSIDHAFVQFRRHMPKAQVLEITNYEFKLT